jgi:ribose 5-phosphate isomerase B
MKNLITEKDLIELEKKGIKVVVKNEQTIFTPLALDRIRSSKFTVVQQSTTEKDSKLNSSNTFSNSANKIIIGSDHTGFKTKNDLTKNLLEKGYEVLDAGTFDENPCDYPDLAKLVASRVANGEFNFGILIDASGIPSSIVANKFKGIRAATCYNAFSARSSRAHNNSNILVLGARALGEETIKIIVDEWLSTKFDGGRHQKRLDKLNDIENENFG